MFYIYEKSLQLPAVEQLITKHFFYTYIGRIFVNNLKLNIQITVCRFVFFLSFFCASFVGKYQQCVLIGQKTDPLCMHPPTPHPQQTKKNPSNCMVQPTHCNLILVLII